MAASYSHLKRPIATATTGLTSGGKGPALLSPSAICLLSPGLVSSLVPSWLTHCPYVTHILQPSSCITQSLHLKCCVFYYLLTARLPQGSSGFAAFAADVSIAQVQFSGLRSAEMRVACTLSSCLDVDLDASDCCCIHAFNASSGSKQRLGIYHGTYSHNRHAAPVQCSQDQPAQSI